VAVSVYNPPDTGIIPLTGPEGDLVSMWRKRRESAITDRRRYESTWYMCQSFLAGRQWVGWNPRTRRVVEEPNTQKRERHTVNVVPQFHQTILGKIYVEDLRPDLLFSRDDQEAQGVAEHSRKVAKFAWDSEVDADRRLYLILHKMLTFGTSGGRCIFDRNQGQLLGQVPVGPDGKPILDPEQARAYVLQAAQQGQQAAFVPLREGRILWEPLSPFQILPPPGVESEEDFPWLIVERPMAVSTAKLRWPDAADKIRNQDLRVLDSRDLGGSDDTAPAAGGRLKEHVMISTGYELPSPEYPDGQVANWTESALLDHKEQLPYRLRGKPHHGVVVFHYHRVDGRFWGKGVVEDLIGPQRQKNRARSQMIEMKDRNLGRVYARKGTITAQNKPTGKIMELIEVPLHVEYPQETFGTPVGPWIENEARLNDEDMQLVAGLREVSLGQAPAGVSAYASMALLAEQDERRVGPVLKLVRQGIGDLVLLTLELIKEYWPDGKHMAVAGPDAAMEEFIYTRSQLPEEFYVDVSKNAPLPTSPATEAQKIFDIYHAAIAAGAPLPPEWLKESLDQGKAMPFPKREEQVQMRKAEMEQYMMQQGQMVIPDYYDDDFLHIQVHRMAQMEHTGVPQSMQFVQLLEQHIQMHAQNAAMKKPGVGSAGGSVPQLQGAHGIEAQNGPTNMQGLAQTASGQAPPQNPQAGGPPSG